MSAEGVTGVPFAGLRLQLTATGWPKASVASNVTPWPDVSTTFWGVMFILLVALGRITLRKVKARSATTTILVQERQIMRSLKFKTQAISPASSLGSCSRQGRRHCPAILHLLGSTSPMGCGPSNYPLQRNYLEWGFRSLNEGQAGGPGWWPNSVVTLAGGPPRLTHCCRKTYTRVAHPAFSWRGGGFRSYSPKNHARPNPDRLQNLSGHLCAP